MTTYDILSPDGFSMHPTNTYLSITDAIDAYKEWKKRYEKQGYYSSNGNRIPLNHLENYCTLVTMAAGQSLFEGKKENLHDVMHSPTLNL